MSTGVDKSAISSILWDKDFDLKTLRMKIARESAHKVLDAILSDNQSANDTFTLLPRLSEKLEALATPTSSKRLSTQKQRL